MPHAVAWTFWLPCNHDQDEGQEEDLEGPAEIEGDSPYLMEEEADLNEFARPESNQQTGKRSSPRDGALSTFLLLLSFLFGRGGSFLSLPVADELSSLVGESDAEDGKFLRLLTEDSSFVGELNDEERLECLFE